MLKLVVVTFLFLDCVSAFWFKGSSINNVRFYFLFYARVFFVCNDHFLVSFSFFVPNQCMLKSFGKNGREKFVIAEKYT